MKTAKIFLGLCSVILKQMLGASGTVTNQDSSGIEFSSAFVLDASDTFTTVYSTRMTEMLVPPTPTQSMTVQFHQNSTAFPVLNMSVSPTEIKGLQTALSPSTAIKTGTVSTYTVEERNSTENKTDKTKVNPPSVQWLTPEQIKHLIIQLRMEYITRGLSFAFGIISLIVLSSLRLPSSTKFFVHKNLLLAYICTDGFVIIGHPNIEKRLTYHKGPCTFVSIANYYFGLTLFSWMLVEAVQIIIMLVQVFESKSRTVKHVCFLVFGWGSPLLITVISVSARFKDFENSALCYTLHDIWIFRSPVAMYLSMNGLAFVFIISVVVRQVCVSARYSGNWRKLVRTVRSLLVLYPVLGISFVLGLFLDPRDIVKTYFFIVFNGFLGFLFFVFHCVLDEQVRTVFMRDVVGRPSHHQQCTTKSLSKSNNNTKKSIYSSNLPSSSQQGVMNLGLDSDTKDENAKDTSF